MGNSFFLRLENMSKGEQVVAAAAAATAMLAYGKISFDLLQFSIVASVLYVGTTMFGAKFFRANGNEHFRKAALGLLTLIAILMLYSVFK